MKVAVKILDERIHDWGLPRYESDGAAAIDLRACIDEPMEIKAGDPAVLISSGIALGMGSPEIAAIIAPRSGRGHKEGLVLGNGIGLIDSDYTGAVLLSTFNRNPPGGKSIRIEPGERIAQLRFVPVIRPTLEVVDEFETETARGAGGLHGQGVRYGRTGSVR